MESVNDDTSNENALGLLENFLVLQDREYALSVLSNFLSATQAILDIADEYDDKIICPYEQTIVKHLGSNYKPVPIRDIEVPSTFCLEKINESTTKFAEKNLENTLQQYDTMCRLASSKGFEGYFNPNLGNAFAVVSGEDVVLDEKRLQKYLDFLESLDTITNEDLETDPIGIAKRLLVKYEQTIT